MITAHSGSDGYIPNSLEFVQAMIDGGVEALEIDVHVSSDQTLYVSHDATDKWSDQAKLSQVYNRLKNSGNSDLILNVDCKDGRVGPLALALAKDLGVYDQVVLSGSLNLTDYSAEERQHLFYNLENHINLEDWPLADSDFKKILEEISQAGVSTVQSYYRLIDLDLIEKIHQAGLQLSVWTIDDPQEMTNYLDMGADNITTNIALAYQDFA